MRNAIIALAVAEARRADHLIEADARRRRARVRGERRSVIDRYRELVGAVVAAGSLVLGQRQAPVSAAAVDPTDGRSRSTTSSEPIA